MIRNPVRFASNLERLLLGMGENGSLGLFDQCSTVDAVRFGFFDPAINNRCGCIVKGRFFFRGQLNNLTLAIVDHFLADFFDIVENITDLGGKIAAGVTVDDFFQVSGRLS